jgi:hypothetical protein
MSGFEETGGRQRADGARVKGKGYGKGEGEISGGGCGWRFGRGWSPGRWSLGRRGAVVRQLEGALTLLVAEDGQRVLTANV